MGTRREQVVQAASRLLVEVGTHGLTHRKVDVHAGVPLGTTSNYFPNRVALVRAVLSSVPCRDAEFIDWATAEDKKVGDDELLLVSLRRIAEFFIGPGRFHMLVWYRMVIDGSSEPEVRAAVTEAVVPMNEYCRAVLSRCGSREQGTHAGMVLAFIGGLVFVQHVDPIPRFDLDRVLTPYARGVMHVIQRDAVTDRGADVGAT